MPLLRKIVQMLAPDQRRQALVLLVLLGFGVLLETLCTGLVFPAVGLLTRREAVPAVPWLDRLQDALGRPSAADLILTVMLGLVALYLLKNLYLAFLAGRQTRFTFGIQHGLSQRLFALYLQQPYAFHLQRNSAQLLRNATGEVTLLADLVGHALLFGSELLVLAAIAALLVTAEPVGTLVAAGVLGAAAWGFYRATRARIARWGAQRHKHELLRYQHLQQGLGAAKEAKVLGREAAFIERYQEHNARSARAGQRQAAVQMLPRLWLELLAIAGVAILAAVMLAQGRAPEAIVPMLALFAVATFRLLPAVDRMLYAAQGMRFAAPAVEALHRELALPPAAPARPRAAAAPLRSEIRLSGVSYTYPGASEPALREVHVAVARGEKVGFVGVSGAGKSTLVDVILGLLAPQTGIVMVDGRDIRQDLRAWQDQLGYVPQSIYLTDDSLRRNVAFGIAEAEIDEARVARALRAAQLDEFVAGLPRGAETLVGERGVRLSGGQRQRIGIARALYHDPDVLVLDEATSALDVATERGVMQAVAALQGAKTILIVAHRLSTVAGCGRLFRLDAGRVVEESERTLLPQAV